MLSINGDRSYKSQVSVPEMVITGKSTSLIKYHFSRSESIITATGPLFVGTANTLSPVFRDITPQKSLAHR
jgi:hypothetical protein